MTTYVTLTKAAKILEIPYYYAKTAYLTDDGFPQPHVYIGTRPGWPEHLIKKFGQSVGLLDDNGHRTTQKRSYPQPIDPQWRAEFRAYLGQKQVSALLGIPESSLETRHHQGRFLPPAIHLGRMAGWDRQELITYGRQMGYKIKGDV